MKFLFIFSILFSSCSLFQSNNEFQKLAVKLQVTSKDYADHLASLGDLFERSDGVKLIKKSKTYNNYLNQIVKKIEYNNELLFKNKKKFKIEIVKYKSPYMFSLPGRKIYLSSSLLVNFLKSESLFVAALTTEMIKSEKMIYLKKSITPKGNITHRKINSLASIPLEYKKLLNEWSYFSLKRAGFDESAVLNWIQLQNKNAIDFTVQNINKRSIVEEELAFKRFLSTQNEELDKREYVSSKMFYRFTNYIRAKTDES